MDYHKNLLEIYKVESDKYNKTRDIQWKMNIAIWTVIIVAIYAQSENKLSFSNQNCVMKIIIYLTPFLIHLSFVHFIHGSLTRSLRRMHNAANLLLDNTLPNSKWMDLNKSVKDKYQYWQYLQLLITIFLLVIFYISSK